MNQSMNMCIFWTLFRFILLRRYSIWKSIKFVLILCLWFKMMYVEIHTRIFEWNTRKISFDVQLNMKSFDFAEIFSQIKNLIILNKESLSKEIKCFFFSWFAFMVTISLYQIYQISSVTTVPSVLWYEFNLDFVLLFEIVYWWLLGDNALFNVQVYDSVPPVFVWVNWQIP